MQYKMKLKTILLFTFFFMIATESRADALSGMGEAIMFYFFIGFIGLIGLIGTIVHFISPNAFTAWSCFVTGIAIVFLSLAFFKGGDGSNIKLILGFTGLGITCFLFLKFIRYYQSRNNKKEN